MCMCVCGSDHDCGCVVDGSNAVVASGVLLLLTCSGILNVSDICKMSCVAYPETPHSVSMHVATPGRGGRKEGRKEGSGNGARLHG